MPVVPSDTITFHIEFYEGDTAPTTGLFRDGFECSLSKQLTTDFWDTTTKDIYVRGTDVATATAADDFNNAVELNGQDWFVFEADAVRADDDHLCTTSSDSAKGISCDTIKCIVRRKMVTEDPDDTIFDLSGTTTELKMTIPYGYSYILMNQNDSTTLAETSK